MNMDKNAKLTPLGRMMLDGHTPAKAAAVAGVSWHGQEMAGAFACIHAGVPPCR